MIELNVSIIVPVRNEAYGLRPFLESLLAQTVQPAEIIFADGGSEDQTKALIGEYIHQGQRIRLIADEDAYPGRARNLAIQAAQTEWIAMTDAGTVVQPDWLEKLLAQAAGAEIVLGSYEPILSSFFKQCLALCFVVPTSKIAGRDWRGPSTASLMIRKTLWQALGQFPETLRACEDLLFFERFAQAKPVIHYAPEALVRWHIAGNFAAVFRRFRAYSLHTLKAGLGKSWHLAVARMYLVALFILALGIVHHWGWLALLVVGLMMRVHKSIRLRRGSLTLTHRTGLRTYGLCGVILLCIDAALWMGTLDYFTRKR